MRVFTSAAVVVALVAAGGALGAGAASAAPAATAGSAASGTSTSAAPVSPTVHRSDFLGNGYNDLALGAPGGTVSGKAGAGYVVVTFGSRSGLQPARRVVLTQGHGGIPGTPTANAGFGSALAVGDFNGDGYTDLAIGAPGDAGGKGSVTIVFGSAHGFTHATRVVGTARLGTALAAGDVARTGRAQLLATQTPSNFGELDRFSVPRHGYTVHKEADQGIYGSTAIAVGDMNGDGYADVVASFAEVGGSMALAYYPGSAHGVVASKVQVRMYEGGADMAMADLNHDGRADLVVGKPLPPFGGCAQDSTGGSVSVWYGKRSVGLGAAPSQTITERTAGMPGGAWAQCDEFGSSVALGDVNGDGWLDLAVGAQQKTVNGHTRAGAVTILRGGPKGFTTKGAQFLTLSTAGLHARAGDNSQFGWMVDLADFNHDGHADLAATAIGQGETSPGWPFYGDGSLSLVTGTVGGLAPSRAAYLTPASFGAPAHAALFGWVLAR
ncbi:FG-GAP-like repeat-containing protein [Streptacidiphilus jiangxiensis]|uniref:FG-GAP-like repeat-containing protein n=1 Tax=Streptacidiphilus jiangxiensis TaxID=235985 RepID=UPI001160D677|nr:FG-GAP-like repeat-containing protein [Streptacidiphilus jiangxiensis]